jgi:RNA polymerase sigma-70 factor (ECF subfamily)
VDEAAEFAGLVAGLKSGDPTAASEVYQRFGPFIRAAVRRQLHHLLRPRFDSLDFVQDVWASFLAAPPDRHAFENPQALLAYLRQVAYNKLADVHRLRFKSQKANIRRESPVGDDGGPDEFRSPSPTPSQWAIAGEEWDRLISQFPAGHRAILQRLREGYSHDDIARMARVSLSTVDRIVRRLKDLTRL